MSRYIFGSIMGRVCMWCASCRIETRTMARAEVRGHLAPDRLDVVAELLRS